MKRLLLLCALCLTACATKPEPSRPGDIGDTAPPADRWDAAGPQQQGDVKVSVVGAELLDGGTAFAVRVSIENTHPSRRGRYHTWAGDATLTDNFGNRYRAVSQRPGGVRDEPLNPGAPVADVLVFEAPVSTAGRVELDLPGANVGAGGGFRFTLTLKTSGERLTAVRRAAEAQEAEARERLAAIAAREGAAKRKAEEAARKAEEDRREAERRREERLAAEEKAKRDAEVKAAEAARDAERIRAEAEKRRAADEFAALPGKLAAAKQNREAAQDKLAQIKKATSRYPYSTPTPPDDFFQASGKYIYFTAAQKAARTEELTKEVERLNAEIASAEARLKAGAP